VEELEALKILLREQGQHRLQTIQELILHLSKALQSKMKELELERLK
jgi:hypothetical protein